MDIDKEVEQRLCKRLLQKDYDPKMADYTIIEGRNGLYVRFPPGHGHVQSMGPYQTKEQADKAAWEEISKSIGGVTGKVTGAIGNWISKKITR